MEVRGELPLFFFSLAVYLQSGATGNLILQKTCFPEGPPGIKVLCDDSERLKEIATMNTVRNSIREALPVVTVLLAGSWRDGSGLSYPLVMLGLCGEILGLLVDFVSFRSWSLTPWVDIGIANLVSGLFGSRALVTMSCLAYIVDRTPPEQRTTRMSVVLVSILGAVAIASFSGGYLLAWLDYGWFYGLVFVLYLIAGLTAWLRLEEGPARPGASLSLTKTLKRFGVVFRTRGIAWLFLTSSCFLTSLVTSEGTVGILYQQKILKMPPTDAGLLGGYRMLISVLAATLITPLLKHCFKMSDMLVALICTIPSSIAAFGMSFARTTLQAYLFTSFDFMRIVLLSTLWSLVTRCVKNTQLGVFSSFLSVGEGLLPLALNPLYALIFSLTVDSKMPGAFYLLSGGAVILTAICILWALFVYDEKDLDVEEEENITESKTEIYPSHHPPSEHYGISEEK